MKSTRESLWAVAPRDRPREKLARLGPGGLTDSELVALVLGSGLPGVNVLDNAASLLEQAGGVQELMVMTVRELMALMGVGVATAGRVVAVAELWRRAHNPLPGVVIERPADVVSIVRAFTATRSASRGQRGVAEGSDARREVVGRSRVQSEVAQKPVQGELDPSLEVPAPEGIYVVVADEEMRVRVVVPLASGDGEGIPSLVPRLLHEVLYRGGSAFALAICTPEALAGADDHDFGATRDVLKLAASTVGLRYLSTVIVSPTSWSAVD